MRRANQVASPRLKELRRRFEKWRAQVGGKGGRSKPIPEELWAEAVEIARAHGVSATARALRLSWYALSERVNGTRRAEPNGPGSNFVELGPEQLFLAGKTTFQFIGRDGERLRIDAADPRAVDLVEVALAFWSRDT
jgi:hypothetical protein